MHDFNTNYLGLDSLEIPLSVNFIYDVLFQVHRQWNLNSLPTTLIQFGVSYRVLLYDESLIAKSLTPKCNTMICKLNKPSNQASNTAQTTSFSNFVAQVVLIGNIFVGSTKKKKMPFDLTDNFIIVKDEWFIFNIVILISLNFHDECSHVA